MKFIWTLVATVAGLGLAAGCVTPPKETAQSGPTATCYVCRYNNDLACVRVHVRDSTPRAEYQGRTYYFCSQECRDEFQKNPIKYLPKSEQ